MGWAKRVFSAVIPVRLAISEPSQNNHAQTAGAKETTMPHTAKQIMAHLPPLDHADSNDATRYEEHQEIHRVYIIWPFRHISHKTETDSIERATAVFAQLMRMRHQSYYAIGVGWEVNGRLKKYLDFKTGVLQDIEPIAAANILESSAAG
jgi:hypothetical protein